MHERDQNGGPPRRVEINRENAQKAGRRDTCPFCRSEMPASSIPNHIAGECPEVEP